METMPFRAYVERRSEGDGELRQFIRQLDDQLLDADSWRTSWDVLRQREADMPFVLAVRKLWQDYYDMLAELDRKRPEQGYPD